MNNIVAVDVGFDSTGLSIWEVTKDSYKLLDLWCVSEVYKKPKSMSQAKYDADVLSKTAREISAFIAPYVPKGLVAELPSGGSKSSRACRCMGMGTALIVTVATMIEISTEWYTPSDIKKVVTGEAKGEKDEIMIAMAERFPELLAFPKYMMEHMADSCACFLAAQDGVLIKQVRNLII